MTAAHALRDPEKPATLAGDLRNLPLALAPLVAEQRWLVWKWEYDAKRGKWTKVPYRAAQPDVKAASNNPRTWADHATAVRAVEAGRADGIGFALFDSDIGALDLDACRDPATGDVAPWAWTLIDEAQSYVEITVSGTGLRIIGRAAGGYVHRNQAVPDTDGSRLETYRRATRYIVVTGLQLAGSYEELADIDAVIDTTVERLDRKPEPEPGPFDFGGDLPPELDRLVRQGVPESKRSEAFHHAVCWLKDLDYTVEGIEALLSRHPNGIAEKYQDRLRREIERCYGKAKDKGEEAQAERPKDAPQPIPLRWHGETDPNLDREWLVRNLVPKEGKGLGSGQWGTAKTFVALDLSASVMTREAFAGRRVERQGGVLFVAPEGAYEIPVRLRGLVQGKLQGLVFSQFSTGAKTIDPARLPFAWIDECPPLVGKDAVATLTLTARAVAERLERDFGLPLALIVIDTVAASSGVTDENAAAENHRVMAALEALSKATGAFVLGVDHFGKAVETGTRGSSAKEAAADVVLAMLGDRDDAGNVSNLRMGVRKLRGGATGAVTPYSLDVVQLGEDRNGEPVTTCVVRWQLERAAEAQPAGKRERWPTSLRVFQRAMQVALTDHGKRTRPFGAEGPEVLAVAEAKVRAEFVAAYPVDGETNETRTDAKRKAFSRSLKAALDRELVVSREIDGTDVLWLREERDE